MSSRSLLLIFLSLHAIIWVLLPTLLSPNPLLDMIETTSWGHEWQLGYEKHPPLSSWLVEAMMYVSGRQLWGYFLLSQLSVTLCFYCMYRLALALKFSSLKALLSVLLLEGIYYYNITSPEFNPNVLLLPLWSALALSFFYAVERKSLSFWLISGVLMALAILAKYYSLLLFFPIAALLLMTEEGRASLQQKGPYMALALCMLLLLPHFWWVIHHQFTTLFYVLYRTEHGKTSLLSHIIHPLRFTFAQALSLIGAFLLFLSLRPQKPFYFPSLRNERFSTLFPWIMGLMPFVVTLAVSFITGAKLKSMWGTPLWNFAGILLLLSCNVTLSPQYLKRFAYGFGFIFLLMSGIYTGQMLFGIHKRAHFPGKALAETVTETWHQHYGTELPLIAGSQWLAGNAAFYSIDRPSVLIDLDNRKSPWTSIEELKTKGGIVLWEETGDAALPVSLEQLFPTMMIQSPLTLPSLAPSSHQQHQIYWAIIPPSHS